MEVSTEKKDNFAVVNLSGPVDGFDHADLQACLYDLERDNVTRIIVDFKKVDYINSTAIATLYSCAVEFRKKGGDLCCVHLNDRVEKIFKCLNAPELLAIAENMKDARRAIAV